MYGCVTCQFENHTHAVMGWPLGDASLNCNTSIMLNLLGEADDKEGVQIGACACMCMCLCMEYVACAVLCTYGVIQKWHRK
jgi:phosphoribosylaminoimidazole carboxylase (NCAIR synthetase)